MAIGSIRSLAYGRHAPFSAFASTPAHYSTASQDLMYSSPHAVVFNLHCRAMVACNRALQERSLNS